MAELLVGSFCGAHFNPLVVPWSARGLPLRVLCSYLCSCSFLLSLVLAVTARARCQWCAVVVLVWSFPFACVCFPLYVYRFCSCCICFPLCFAYDVLVDDSRITSWWIAQFLIVSLHWASAWVFSSLLDRSRSRSITVLDWSACSVQPQSASLASISSWSSSFSFVGSAHSASSFRVIELFIQPFRFVVCLVCILQSSAQSALISSAISQSAFSSGRGWRRSSPRSALISFVGPASIDQVVCNLDLVQALVFAACICHSDSWSA